MAKLSIRRPTVEHPPWCAVPYFGTDDHDPHVSHRELVAEEAPARCAVEAYLLRPKRPVDPHRPKAALAALEFRRPGAEPASFLLTLAQLRRLEEALYRLIKQGELVG